MNANIPPEHSFDPAPGETPDNIPAGVNETEEALARENRALRAESAECRRAEASRRDQEPQFRTMVDDMPVIIWATDERGEMQFVNRAYENFFGRTLEDVQRGGWRGLVHPEDEKKYHESFQYCLRLRKPFRAEARVRRADGAWRWIDSHGGPRFSSSGAFLGFTGSSLEITARKRAEGKMSHLASFPETNPTPVMEITLRGKITYINPVMAALFPDILKRQTTHPLLKQWPEIQAAEKAGRQTLNLEVEAGGRIFEQSVHFVPETRLIRIYLRDITERRLSEEVLRKSQDLYSTLAEAGPVLVWSSDADGRADFVNKKWLDYTGVTLHELNQEGWGRVHHREDASIHAYLWAGARRTGEPFETELRCRRFDGEYGWFLSRAVPWKDEQGSIRKWIGVLTDITDRRMAEQKLQDLTWQVLKQARTLDAVLASSPNQMFLLDANFRFSYASRAFVKTIETDPAALIGRSWQEAGLPPEVMAPLHRLSAEVMASGDEVHGVTALVIKGAKRYIEYTINPVGPDSDIGNGVVVNAWDITGRKEAEDRLRKLNEDLEQRVRDRTAELTMTIEILQDEIVERKRAEAALRESGQELNRSREELRRLSLHLQSVREEERSHIAREIHDELGQILTALKVETARMKSRASESSREKVQSMLELIDQAIESVKKISTELRPAMLDHLGLVPTLEWHAREFHKRTGIDCVISCDVEQLPIDQDQSIAIFRIFQESLTNVVRHAGATLVKTCLRKKEGAILLTIEDNGRGISEEEVLRPESFGLLGIRERVHSFGGTVNVLGIPGEGTLVSVTIPAA